MFLIRGVLDELISTGVCTNSVVQMEAWQKNTFGEFDFAELKKDLSGNLVAIERRIFNLESQFLEEVACNGNLLRRWTETGCIKLPSAKSAIYKKCSSQILS